MDVIYYIASCDTCRKIIKSLPDPNKLKYRDIKQDPLSELELDHLKSLAGSYQALFSRKAQLYKSLGLKEKTLTEEDFRNHILNHYTFLSRPVFVIDGRIFIGNSQQNINQVIKALQ